MYAIKNVYNNSKWWRIEFKYTVRAETFLLNIFSIPYHIKVKG